MPDWLLTPTVLAGLVPPVATLVVLTGYGSHAVWNRLRAK